MLIFARSLLRKPGINQKNMALGHVFRRVLLLVTRAEVHRRSTLAEIT